jgi:hypothetical protein
MATDIEKDVQFDPNGEKLWVEFDMKGLYGITYVYQLLDKDKKTPLSSPLKTGNNIQLDDDFYEIKNDLNPNQPLSDYEDRQVNVSFLIVQVKDDFGYKVKATIFQGATFKTAVELDFAESPDSSKVGSDGIEEQIIKLNLVK